MPNKAQNLVREWDKQQVFRSPVFKDLENRALFRLARADCGGCGVVWNDDLNLSRYEIWANGVDI